MAEVKWIKLSTDLFNNRKIRMIESMPEGDALVVIWMKLLILAGNINDSGLIYFTRDIPYTEQMLATEFGRPLSIIQLALNTFSRFEMIDVVDDIIHVSNWQRYQNIEGMEKIREQNRLRKQNQRERDKQKQLTESRDCHVTVTQGHATDIDKDKELDKKNYMYSATIKAVIAYLNDKADTHYKYSSQPTERHIIARLNEGYALDDFKTVIDKKVQEWKGTEWEKFLRPETLFGNKFENYLNAKIRKPKAQNAQTDFISREYTEDQYQGRMAKAVGNLADDIMNDFPDMEAEDQFVDYLDPDMDMAGV